MFNVQINVDNQEHPRWVETYHRKSFKLENKLSRNISVHSLLSSR